MSAPAPATGGELSESSAISAMTAAREKREAAESREAQSGRGRRPDQEDADPDIGDPDADEPVVTEDDDAPIVEGDEFAEGEEDAAAAFGDNTRVKFEDGTEVTVHELKRGFLRERDYTHKTQELATQRKAHEADRLQYAAQQKQVAERLTPLIQSTIDWIQGQDQRELADLKNVDPGAWSARMHDIEQKRKNGMRLMQEQQALVDSATQEEQAREKAQRDQTVSASRDALQKAIPAAKKDFEGWYQRVGKYVLESGVSPDLWNEVIDHPVVTLAWKAMQYDAAARKSPATRDKLASLPPVVRSGARRPAGAMNVEAVKRADQAFGKSHSIDDAVAAFSARRVAAQQRPTGRR